MAAKAEFKVKEIQMKPWRANFEADPPRPSPPPEAFRPPHVILSEGVEHISAQLGEIRELLVQITTRSGKAEQA